MTTTEKGNIEIHTRKMVKKKSKWGNPRKKISLLIAFWTFGSLARGVQNEATHLANPVVGQVLKKKGQVPSVILEFGAKQGLQAGSLYEAFRERIGTSTSGHQSGLIKTGEIKITELGETWATGLVTQMSHPVAKLLFKKYPYLMAGDELQLKKTPIEPKTMLSPRWVLRFSELFEDPRPRSGNYELSQDGKKVLSLIAAEYRSLKIPTLGVFGYSDHLGPSDLNQAESYERALTVRQYLLSMEGFRNQRVEAFGLGEHDLATSGFEPNHEDINRRIEFRTFTPSKLPYRGA